jgi:acyl-CoA thioester hydrolase
VFACCYVRTNTLKPYQQAITTRWADIDATRHLRHSAYLDWATHVRTTWLDAQGFTMKSMAEMHIAPILLEENIRYLREALLGDSLVVDLACVGLSSDASRWHMRQHFRRGDTVCAIHEVKGAWLDTDKRKISPPPPGVLEAVSALPRADDFAEITAQQAR